jgi:DNA primase
MDILQTTHLQEPLRSEVVGHYERFKDRLVASFEGAALIPVYMPEGLNGAVTRGGALGGHVPDSVATIEVPHAGGARRYLALEGNSLLWAAHRYVVGFESWTNRRGNPLTPAYARLLIVPRAPDVGALLEGANIVLGELDAASIEVVVLSDGVEIALWMPLKDDVAYPDLRVALHRVMTAAAERSHGLLDSGTDKAAPVRLSVRPNAPDLGSSLPYTVIAGPELRVLLPADRRQLEAELRKPHDLKAAQGIAGDPFREAVKRIGPQRLPRMERKATGPVPMYEPRAAAITASIEILSDGVPRTADQILAELHRRQIELPASADRKYIYVRLKDYIERTTARGRKPAIVQDPDRRFRINHPGDDWPVLRPAAAREDPGELIKRLRAASSGKSSEEFELAVCAAFERIGFMVTHVGGNDAPDGYFDAPLGTLAYRVMLECKTSYLPMQRPDIYEASKWQEAYHAQYCTLVGPEFGDTAAIITEAQKHQVAVWSVDDIARVLQGNYNLLELRQLFEPGVVEDKLDDLEWEAAHGLKRRIRVVCALIKTAGWNAQKRAVKDGRADQAPRLTLDAAMFLVNEALSAAGSDRAVTREEVYAASEHLTDPLVAEAVRIDGSHGAIVLTMPH